MPEGFNWEQTRFLCRSGRSGLAELKDHGGQANGLPLGTTRHYFGCVTEASGMPPTAFGRIAARPASNRKLKDEIVRRQSAQQSLKKSEQHQGLLLEQSRQMQEQLRSLRYEQLGLKLGSNCLRSLQSLRLFGIAEAGRRGGPAINRIADPFEHFL